MITSPRFWKEWERLQVASYQEIVEHTNFLQSVNDGVTTFQEFSGSPPSTILAEMLDIVEEGQYDHVNLITRESDILQLRRDYLEYNHFSYIFAQTRYIVPTEELTDRSSPSSPTTTSTDLPPGYKISEMTPSDLLSQLDHPGWQSTSPDPNTLSLVLQSTDSTPVGMILGKYHQYKQKRFVEIQTPIIKSDHQGKGLAKCLVNQFATQVRDRGCMYITTTLTHPSESSQFLADIFSHLPLQTSYYYSLDLMQPRRE